MRWLRVLTVDHPRSTSEGGQILTRVKHTSVNFTYIWIQMSYRATVLFNDRKKIFQKEKTFNFKDLVVKYDKLQCHDRS